MMGISKLVKLLWTTMLSWILMGIPLLLHYCSAYPGVRVIQPQFYPAPPRVSYTRSETARLFCSIRHLGERTVFWRKLSETNPLTIGTSTWIDDPRIYVDHTGNHQKWDLVIKGITSRDAGKYECRISTKDVVLRQIVQLSVTGHHTGQMKRNPEIVIMGSQFVKSGEMLSLMCNASVLGNPQRSLAWDKDSMELYTTNRVTIMPPQFIHNGETTSSNLRIHPSRPEDSGLYTCRSRDNKLITSAQVQVLTAGSNNVKRAGSGSSRQERGAVLSTHYCPNSHLVHILLLTILVVLIT